MCDLWKHTTDNRVKSGDIPRQIEWAISKLGSARHLKLYNSGNFFDQNAIPVDDYEKIAHLLKDFDTITVECHPKLIYNRCVHFNDLISGKLEVAIGLETIHPDVLPLLNKQMDLNEFQQAIKFLGSNRIGSRAFILLRPPFLSEEEGIEWAKKSLDFAFETGVECCVVIPTRTGNGAMDHLKEKGYFSPPHIKSLEEVMEYGIRLRSGRVFGDLWDIHKFSNCDECLDSRTNRIRKMNLYQEIAGRIECHNCV
jgi:hypothetical protein